MSLLHRITITSHNNLPVLNNSKQCMGLEARAYLAICSTCFSLLNRTCFLLFRKSIDQCKTHINCIISYCRLHHLSNLTCKPNISSLPRTSLAYPQGRLLVYKDPNIFFLSRLTFRLTNKLAFYLTHETPAQSQLGFLLYFQKLLLPTLIYVNCGSVVYSSQFQ